MPRIAAVFVFFMVSAAFALATAQESAAPPAAPKPATSGKTKQPAAKQAAPKQAQAPGPQSGPCIGVLSRLGENFTLRKVGVTAFGNDETLVPIGAWHIDDMVTARIAAFINKRVTVRRITYPAGTFASLDTPQFLRLDTKVFESLARPFLTATRCTHYLTVIPSTSTYANTNQVLRGLGIVSPPGFVEKFFLYAYAEFRLYDENLSLLEQKYASLDPRNPNRFFSSFAADPVHGPHREVDKSYWSDPSGVGPNAALRDAMRDLVARAVDATLPEFKRMP